MPANGKKCRQTPILLERSRSLARPGDLGVAAIVSGRRPRNAGGPMPMRYIGKPLKRKEDPRLIQGISHYVDDLQFSGMHYAAFLRSPHAHAKIRSIDLSKARTAHGVVLALAGSDVAGAIQPVPCAAQIPDMKLAPRPVLATDRVRFVGEAVAVLVATEPYAARDALDLIEVDYEPL